MEESDQRVTLPLGMSPHVPEHLSLCLTRYSGNTSRSLKNSIESNGLIL